MLCYDPTLARVQLGRNLKQIVTKLMSKIKLQKKNTLQKNQNSKQNIRTKHFKIHGCQNKN